MIKLPEPTEGAYRIIAYAVVILGILNLFSNPIHEHHDHFRRLPEGRVAGIFYIVAAGGYLTFSYTRKPKDDEKS